MKKSFILQQNEISFVKNTFTQYLIDKLGVIEVQGPILSQVGNGMQDNLSGIEKAVQVNVKCIPGATFEVVHSLAKWKRHTLGRFGFQEGEGLFVHMKALRPDEDSLDPTHSVYVDQWDWERVISEEERNEKTLRETVQNIFRIIKHMEHEVWYKYPEAVKKLPEDIFFIDSEELLQKYPNLSSKERENAICKEHGCVFIQRIGDKLSNGEPHDGRAPDYDDWDLNGDILFWFEPLNCALEISSMGIRVNEESLRRQLALSHKEERATLPYHKMLLEGKLPLTIGGGIGQSRLCMLLLDRVHIGEVQASIWPEEMREECEKHNIILL